MSKKIAEIRNALQVIQINCQQVPGNWMSKDRTKMTKTVIEQVERIYSLLPQGSYKELII